MDTGIKHLLYLTQRHCALVRFFSVKNEANSLQALVDRSSEATDTGGFVSLYSSKQGKCVVFGNDVREERLSCIFQFQIIKGVRYVTVHLILPGTA